MLGDVAFWMHDRSDSVLISDQQLSSVMTASLSARLGLSSEAAHTLAREFARSVRERAGLLVAEGESLYSFPHKSIYEYFVARHLVDSLPHLTPAILNRLEDPRWQEPLLLAVLMLDRQYSQGAQPTLVAVRNDGGGDELVRLRFVAAAFNEGVSVTPAFVGEVVERLITGFARARRPSTRKEIAEVLHALSTGAARDVVLNTLADATIDSASLAQLRGLLAKSAAVAG